MYLHRMRFIDLIPQPHREWWRAWGLDLDLTETRATCTTCTMSTGAIRDGHAFPQIYDARLKCCTFFPEIPNFVWSKFIESQPTPFEGLLSPLRLEPSRDYRERFAKAEFGRDPDLLCPFFEKGGCKIWEHRPSPCVRFVCQSSYEMKGQKVWELTEQLLRLTEETLANDVLLRLGFDVDEIASGHWFEFQPNEVFARAGEIVKSLSPTDVWDLLQPQGEELRLAICAAAANAIGSAPDVKC